MKYLSTQQTFYVPMCIFHTTSSMEEGQLLSSSAGKTDKMIFFIFKIHEPSQLQTKQTKNPINSNICCSSSNRKLHKPLMARFYFFKASLLVTPFPQEKVKGNQGPTFCVTDFLTLLHASSINYINRRTEYDYKAYQSVHHLGIPSFE